MQITVNTDELTELDRQILTLVSGVGGKTVQAEPEKTAKPAAKKTAAKKKKPEPEPEPDPEPIAEDPVPDEPEEPEETESDEEASDEDLLELAVKKATELVGAGEAAKVREALEAAGANRVRELNKDNVRDFFKAL